MEPCILRTTGLTKRFGPALALSMVDFSLRPGEIHALLGVNGAGKSTFIKILSGIIVKDAGEIEIDGRVVDIRSPRDARRAGVTTVQQHPELVMDLDGYQNIFLGQESRRGGLLRRIDHADLKRRGDALLARFPMDIDLSRPVGSLSVVEREVIAVLQALSHEGIRVLILDEPTSTLTEVEKRVVFRMMSALRASGIAIIYITHRLEEVIEIADRFTVFRGGCKITTMAPAEVRDKGHSLAEIMLGETMNHLFPPRGQGIGPGPAAFAVQGLHAGGAFEQISFEARRGEILGVFGLVGSGLDELSKVLFGALPAGAGDMRLEGRTVAPASPREALKLGIFLVPGDRRTEGLTMSQGAAFNTQLANLDRASGRGGLLRRRLNRQASRELAGQVDLRPPVLDRPVSNFSGGNQQKVVIAKGIFTQAKVYIFVEPTVGVDIGARAKLYALMRELAHDAVVMVMSSDCDEVHGLADRHLALYKGRQVGAAATLTRNQLLTAGIMGALQ